MMNSNIEVKKLREDELELVSGGRRMDIDLGRRIDVDLGRRMDIDLGRRGRLER